MTQAQQDALKWLNDHGGDGVIIKFGRVLSLGEIAPHQASTWKALVEQGKCQTYQLGAGKRIRVVKESER